MTEKNASPRFPAYCVVCGKHLLPGDQGLRGPVDRHARCNAANINGNDRKRDTREATDA